MSGNQLAYVEFLCTFVVGLLPSEMRKELLSNKHNIDDHVTVSDESFALLVSRAIQTTCPRFLVAKERLVGTKEPSGNIRRFIGK